MSAVRLDGVSKRFGETTALQPTDLQMQEGEFVTLLGPSGCGKTTTLRMIAGLLDPTQGDIFIGGQRMNEVPIHQRNLGIVFQNYALFPHKTVAENIAFGLKYRSVNRHDRQQRVRQALDLVQLPDTAQRYPRQLSGGQQQRIALARAVVIEPSVLLLDEPLSALDANLREDMRIELKRIQDRIGVTTVFVTHDQQEALAMSDTLVVMREGRVEQVGSPETVYNAPQSEFVARFLGNSNLLAASCTEVSAEDVLLDCALFGTLAVPRERAQAVVAGGSARLVLRAEKLRVSAGAPTGEHSVSVPAVIEAVDYQGAAVRYFLRAGETTLQALNAIDQRPHAVGARVMISVRARDCAALAAEECVR